MGQLFHEEPHMTMGPTLDSVKGCSLIVFPVTASVNNALKVASLKGVIDRPGTVGLLTPHSLLTRIHGLSAWPFKHSSLDLSAEPSIWVSSRGQSSRTTIPTLTSQQG